MKRSGGMCERCKITPAVNVHHKTYANIFSERLVDLIHLCKRCHDLVHGFSDVDLKERKTKSGLEGYFGHTYLYNPDLIPMRQLQYQFHVVHALPPGRWVVQLYSVWEGSPTDLKTFTEEYLLGSDVELFATAEQWRAAYYVYDEVYWQLQR